MAKKINIAVIAKSNPNACGFEIYSPNKAPATHGITQNKYAVILRDHASSDH